MAPRGQGSARAITEPGALIGPRISAPLASTGVAALEIATEALDQFVHTACADKFAEHPAIRYGSAAYYLPTLEEVVTILHASRQDRSKWLQGRHHSDDAVHAIKGEMSLHAYQTAQRSYSLCCGVLWGYFDWHADGFSAANWALTRDAAIWLIEPNTDDIYPLHRCMGGVSMVLV